MRFTKLHYGKRYLGIAIALFVVGSVAFSDGTAVGAESTLVVAVNQEPQDMAAQGTYKEINAPGLRNVLETLIAMDPVSGKYRGILATSWDIVDAQTIRMKLREGVKFHDGSPFNAESAAFAVNWVWSTKNAFTIQEYAGPGEITAKPIGAYEIEVKAAKPDPLLEFRLSLGGISSMKQIQDNKTAHFDTPIGTGPYKFEKWERGQYWTASQNADWWGLSADDAYGTTKPVFKNLKFVIRSEDAARTAMAEAGEADISMFPKGEDCLAAKQAKNYQCVSGPSTTYLYGRLDHSLYAHKALMDPRVREAIFLAIDTASLAEVIGLASVAPGQLGPKGTVGYNADVKAYPYDPQRAAKLLGEAKKDGVDIAGLKVEVVGRTTTPRINTIVEAIGGMLNAAGVKTDVKVQVPQVFNPRVRIAGYAKDPNRQMMQVHVKQNPSGDFGLTLLSNYACPDEANPTGPSRSSVYCDKSFDAQLNEAMAMFGAERDKALQALVKYVHDRYLIVPLALLDRAYLVSSKWDFTFGSDHRVLAVNVKPAP